MMKASATSFLPGFVRSKKQGYSCLAKSLISLLCIFFLVACDSPSGFNTAEPPISEMASTGTVDTHQKLRLASGVEFQVQRGDGIGHRVSARSISIAPRGFGAFNINGINELLIEDSHIDIFPHSETKTAGGNGDESNFVDTLQDYAKSLESIYGIVTRIHIHNIQITLHGAGKDNGNVNVIAQQLIKEFGDNEYPELHGLEFYDDQSAGTLKIDSASWNTESGQFSINVPKGRQ